MDISPQRIVGTAPESETAGNKGLDGYGKGFYTMDEVISKIPRVYPGRCDEMGLAGDFRERSYVGAKAKASSSRVS